MSFITWLLRKLIVYTVYTLLLLSFLIFAPFLLDISPQTYSIKLPQSFSGPLKENDLLSQAQHLFSGEVRGPESIAFYKGGLYTALADGRVIRIQDGKFTVVADVSEGQCEGLWQVSKCGRPLAVKFDSKGNLYVIDAYYGLKRVDIAGGKGSVTTIFNSKTQLSGDSSMFLDDFVIVEGAGSKKGNVYFITLSSAKWAVDDVAYVIAEHENSGRILRYDEDDKSLSVVAGDLSFPNGVELTDAKDALLVNEFNNRRIWKYHIKGSKAGKIEPFIENLPGEPDNIRRSSDPKKETYWVALAIGRISSNPDLFFDILSNKPLIRKAAFRALHFVGQSLHYFGTVSDYIPLKEIGHKVKTGEILFPLLKHRGIVVEIDVKGNVLRALHSPDGSTNLLSEAKEVLEGNKKVLYLGSYYNNYIGRLEIS